MSSFRTFVPRPTAKPKSDWKTIKTFFPYLWEYKGRVLLAMMCLILAKVAGMVVPIVLKELIDTLTNRTTTSILIILPLLLCAYWASRLLSSVFAEGRELLFVRVTQNAVRRVALQVFKHLHELSLRFHLDRQTGGLTQDIERGTRSILGFIMFTLFNILPTLVEMVLLLGYLLIYYDIVYTLIAAGALFSYLFYTVWVTNWRTNIRREMNELNSKAHTQAVESLINYETVKYFNNEEHEVANYDINLKRYEASAIRSQYALSVLNLGQAFIIATAVTLMLWKATEDVLGNSLSLGDLVLVNAFMIQIYQPMNFLGVAYREIRQSLADMERMFVILEQPIEIKDRETAKAIALKEGTIVFSKVNFSYERSRQILFDIDFAIPAGTTLALVGASGSGKSTISRLLYRFYDVESGQITIDGCDVKEVTQASLRKEIGIVPQDTVLFNETIEYNIAYGKPNATKEEIIAAAKAAYIHDFIMSLPKGYETKVGERGLKLSGGEKQRVAIARMVLKNPKILIFDEATSALDTKAEEAIQHEIQEIAKNKTTLIIAHRLSTIAHANQIVVLEEGKIIERGTHAALMEQKGVYFQMWERQQKKQQEDD